MAISLVRRIETEHRNERTTDQTGVHDAAEFALRHKLFDELLKKEEFMDAANCLGKLNLDATSGKVFCVCICMHYPAVCSCPMRSITLICVLPGLSPNPKPEGVIHALLRCGERSMFPARALVSSLVFLFLLESSKLHIHMQGLLAGYTHGS